MMNIEEFEAMRTDMVAEGWRNYINHLDVETVHEIGCVYCEGDNVYAAGLRKGKEYLAYAICRDCDIAEEF